MDKLSLTEFYVGLFIVAIFIVLTMYLWNWLMPGLFGLPTINIYEAVGLLVLIKLLIYIKP